MRRALGWATGAAAATVVLYVGLLGWHTQRDRAADGTCVSTGPYEPWQVVALAIGLGFVAAIATRRSNGWLVAGVCTVTLTVLWSVDAATVDDPCSDDASLWPVGAMFLALGTAFGLCLIALVGELVRRSVRSRPPG
jgi:hypothetical protein